MNNHPFLRHGLLALSLGLASLPVWAEDDCDAPLSRWQTRDAVRQMAATEGWQIQRLKIDDGCYEMRAVDAQGRAFKAKIDPETLKVLKIKPSRSSDARKRNVPEDGADRQARAPRPEGGGTPAPLSSPEPAPQSQAQ
jgi:hypothetical protein